MKKFVITLFILMALGGVVFFFGWAQFTVPPGAFGIIHSKTHGVDPRPIQSGEFRWIWYKLIPTNVEIAVFRLEPVNHTISVKSALPSGNLYAAFAGIQTDFSWTLDASFSFALRPEALIPLVTANNIQNQDDLNSYTRNLAGRIEARLLSRLGSVEGDQLEKIESGSGAEIEQLIQREFPETTNITWLLKSAQFPDFFLYKQVQGLYEEFISRQRDAAVRALGQKAEDRIGIQLRFDELERYGELLTKYPILVEYLALERGLWKPGE